MHNHQPIGLTRRRFLRLGASTIAGAGLMLGNSPWYSLARAAGGELQTPGSYKALVCVYLQGGCDGFSLLIPTDQPEYREYAEVRQRLAIAQPHLIGLSANNTDNPRCGLNADAQALVPLYQEGRLAFVANVGTLIEPTNKAQYESQSVVLPAQLFSHSDQQILWQQLQGSQPTRDGWGARAAQLLSGAQQRDYLTSVTVSGSNYWQTGQTQRPFSIHEDGIVNYAGMDDLESDWQQPRREAFQRVMRLRQDNVIAQAYADLQVRASTITAELGEALAAAPAFSTPPPAENHLANQLNMVAQLISSRHLLGMSRQIFYVAMDGFDVHDAQSTEQPILFQQLAEAMAYFQSTIDELGLDQQVTTFTASDFGRSLSINGDGTDHGWGGHHLVMGGAVRGGDIYGTIPRLMLDGPDSVQNGRVIPTLSASQYAGTLLHWMELDYDAVHQILPELGNFAVDDLGFMRT